MPGPRELAAFSEYCGLCLYCQRHYKSADGWKRHIKNQHPGVWLNLADTWGFEPGIPDTHKELTP